MFDSKGFLIGSSTHDNDMLPNIAGFLEMLKGLKPKGRSAAVFGSFGWGGGACKEIENVLKEAGLEPVLPSLGIQFVPDQQEFVKCYEFGKQFVEKL